MPENFRNAGTEDLGSEGSLTYKSVLVVMASDYSLGLASAAPFPRPNNSLFHNLAFLSETEAGIRYTDPSCRGRRESSIIKEALHGPKLFRSV